MRLPDEKRFSEFLFASFLIYLAVAVFFYVQMQYPALRVENLLLNASAASPDIAADSIIGELSTVKAAGVPFTVTVNTRNYGNAASGASTTTRVTFGTASTDLSVPSIGPLSTSIQTITLSCPSAGAIPYSLMADANRQITESNENNNGWGYIVECSSQTASGASG